MSQITVDTSLCTSDGACVELCLSRSLLLNESGFSGQIPDSACIFCGHCVAVCFCGAVTHRRTHT